MPGKYYDMSKRKREYNFPFQVHGVYYCWEWTPSMAASGKIRTDIIEIAIRLRSSAGNRCHDELNGKTCDIGFPHVLIKRPGDSVKITQLAPRDTVSFQYPASCIEELQKLDMLPDRDMWEINLTAEIESLLKKFQHCLYAFYASEVPDKLDWICFQLLRELSHNQLASCENENTVIKNASAWLQMHFNEKFTVEEIAQRYGMSRSNFYMIWKNNFEISPIQYVLELRLQAAAALLQETPFSISRISDEVGFCSTDNFHHKFKAKYGITPAEYRKQYRNR